MYNTINKFIHHAHSHISKVKNWIYAVQVVFAFSVLDLVSYFILNMGSPIDLVQLVNRFKDIFLGELIYAKARSGLRYS